MSTGGIFQLLTNDGKQDRILMATSLLNKRLLEIENLRTKNPQIKDPTPTLVDIERTHIFHLNAHFKPFVATGYEYMVTQSESGSVAWGQEITFSLPQFGDFFHDMCVHIVLENLKPTDSTSHPNPNGSQMPDVRDQVRYCEYPGERMLQNVSFEVNKTPLDTYTQDDVVFHRLYEVMPHKQLGWDRNMGQQQAHQGTLIHNPGSDEFAEQKFFTDGPQTWKNEHTRLEMWIPLLFWFNLDSRLSIPSVCIPYGQRFIITKLAEAADLCEAISYHGGTPGFQDPIIARCELYTNNIFVNPEIHDIFIKRIGFSMIRVHVRQRVLIEQNVNALLLNKLKWPIETMYIGLRPLENTTNHQNWHYFSRIQQNSKKIPIAYPPVAAFPGVPSLGFSDATWRTFEPIFEEVGVEAHGISLYENAREGFYNSYIPFTRGNTVTPTDPGTLMIAFNLNSGKYQPSGYVNVSRTREMYLNFTSPSLNTSSRAILSISARAINFLLVNDGSAILRYST